MLVGIVKNHEFSPLHPGRVARAPVLWMNSCARNFPGNRVASLSKRSCKTASAAFVFEGLMVLVMWLGFDSLVHPSTLATSGKYFTRLEESPCLGGGLIITGNPENIEAISGKEEDVETRMPAVIMWTRESLTVRNSGFTWQLADIPESEMKWWKCATQFEFTASQPGPPTRKCTDLLSCKNGAM